MKTLASFAILAVLMSCAPAPKLERRSENFFTNKDKLSDGRINLDNKSPADVLKIKYNNEVFLDCELRATDDVNKDLNEVEPVRFSWNLANTYEQSKTLSFPIDERILETEISAKMVVWRHYSTPVIDGVNYELDHTPVVDLLLQPLDSNIQGESQTTVLIENLPTQTFVLFKNGIWNLLSCSVKTTIAPKYEVEFRRIEVKESEI